MLAASRGQRLLAEGLGTCLLLATVIGSGIMGERLAGGNVAIALLGNTLPTGAVLVVLIGMLRADLGRALQSGRDRRVLAQERNQLRRRGGLRRGANCGRDRRRLGGAPDVRGKSAASLDQGEGGAGAVVL